MYSIQFEKPLNEKEAWEKLVKLKYYFEILDTRSSTLEILSSLIGKYKVKSYSIYDANIVAHMIDYSVPVIYTNNVKDFKKFEEIEIINPYE